MHRASEHEIPSLLLKLNLTNHQDLVEDLGCPVPLFSNNVRPHAPAMDNTLLHQELALGSAGSQRRLGTNIGFCAGMDLNINLPARAPQVAQDHQEEQFAENGTIRGTNECLTSEVKPKSANLLDLPRELRDEIHKYLLFDDASSKTSRHFQGPLRLITKDRTSHRWSAHLSLRQTCGSMKAEMDEILSRYGVLRYDFRLAQNADGVAYNERMQQKLLPLFPHLIRHIELIVEIGATPFAAQSEWEWLLKFKNLTRLHFTAISTRSKVGVNSYMLHGIMANLLPFIPKDLRVLTSGINGNETAYPDWRLVCGRDLRTISLHLRHLRGALVPMCEDDAEDDVESS